VITNLQPDEIFVFGSNLAGIHGAGAARQARERFGAQPGVGRGLTGPTGRCYAFPTKDERVETLPLVAIRREVLALYECCRAHPDKRFLLTAVGCGLAGYTPAQIAPLFSNTAARPRNLVLPPEFIPFLTCLQ